MKVLQGYVENRTKEAALAAILLALYFVTKNTKIQVTPILGLDFSGAIILTSASILSWPYTILFSLLPLYLGSSPIFNIISFFVGTQTVFFLSKMVKKEWSQYTPILGQVTGFPTFGLLLHTTGMMDFRVFMVVQAIPILICCLTTFFGGLVIWKSLGRFNIFD